MASLIPGYEYDIFISYRQKDNRHDGWVTEFVDNLKGELESTFKEEVSLYFDINPHDGLTEIHDVDASLKGKLKCLVFIPVISRTFCDPRSFAWEHEFRAFVEQAKTDALGLKVKLADGNVASRVLPVIIHELNQDDIKRCETLLSGVLRGIEFIYKAPGVNRPLRANEDHPHDNLNKIYYRDQINKLANAIDEIIAGLRNVCLKQEEKEETAGNAMSDVQVQSSKASFTKSRDPEEPVRHRKSGNSTGRKTRLIAFSSTVVILALLALFIFTSGSSLPFSRRDWIVVTDFENLTGNPVFDRSLSQAFLITTSQSRYINVFPRSGMFETLRRMESGKTEFIDETTGREIAARENIMIYVVPGISEIGGSYAISAKIHESGSGTLLRSEILYAKGQENILETVSRLSRKIRMDLGESRYDIAQQDKPLSKVTTSSLEALKIFSQGIDRHLKLDFAGARDCYREALRIDTGFTSAKASLGNILFEKFDPEEGKAYLDQAIRNTDNLTEREKLGILAFYSVNVEKNILKGIEYARARTGLYPDDPVARNNLGWYYQNSGKYADALEEYKEAVRINRNMALTYGGILWIFLEKTGEADSALVWSEMMIRDHPANAWGYSYLGSAWLCRDSLKKAASYYERAAELAPDLVHNLFNLSHAYRKQGRHDAAIEVLNRIIKINPDEAPAYYDLAANLQAAGNTDEAQKNFMMFRKIAMEYWLRKYPDDPMTYFTISAVSARLGEMEISQEMFQKAVEKDSTLHFRFAEISCLQGKIPEALAELEMAFEGGYRNLLGLKLSPDLEVLRYDIRFQNLLKEYFR